MAEARVPLGEWSLLAPLFLRMGGTSQELRLEKDAARGLHGSSAA